jgi:hypothetical protein
VRFSETLLKTTTSKKVLRLLSLMHHDIARYAYLPCKSQSFYGDE